ncbi:hypothetical protein FRX31_028280, partial [Thalictrum thalictroides]
DQDVYVSMQIYFDAENFLFCLLRIRSLRAAMTDEAAPPHTQAYVQQLETSRIKLTQLEQELQRARSQGVFFGGGGLIDDQCVPVGINNLGSGSF